MKNKITKYWAVALICATSLTTTSCISDLDTTPLNPKELAGSNVYGPELEAYKSALAKIYAGFAISGNKGGDGDQDVQGVDGGSQASFLRGLWNMQELPTDEAHCNWDGDVGIVHFNYMIWNSGNPFIKGMYYRLFYQVNLVNEFLRETTDDKLDGRGVSNEVKAEIHVYRNDARFLRALSYYYLLDMFRNVPFVTEDSKVGKEAPPQIMAKDLYNYIENELIACENGLQDPFVGFDTKHYGRVTKSAVWMLLSRLYLNAETYIGEKKYNEVITYSNKVMAVGYQLEPKYEDIFKADNDHSPEMIFPIRYEGALTQTWGGMTFLVCSTVPEALKESVNAQDTWQGNRSKSALGKYFKREASYTSDQRFAMLRYDQAEVEEIIDPVKYTHGIPVLKYVNVNKDGSLPPDKLVYADFPLFRLGEVYLNVAEAVLRGATNATRTDAVGYINQLRNRGYNNAAGANIVDAQLTLDFMIDERGRELFFEAQRRTDLVRFGKLTGSNYIWDWKGGVFSGKAVDEKYNIYPIPSDDMGSNSNLIQNPGYN